MPDSNEYKQTLGLRDLYYALVAQDDASAYIVGSPVYIAPAMSAMQEPAVNKKTVYADDGAFDTLSSEGETTLKLEVTDIPLSVLAVLTGAVYDATNKRLFDNGGSAPLVALGFRAKKSTGGYKYYWFLKGRFQKPGEELASDSASPDPKSIKLEYTALKTVYQYTMGSVTDGVKRVVGDSDVTGFSATSWFTTVQVPSYGSIPLFTLTPSPADNATGVAVSTVITLTFSNALITGASGIILMKSTDRSIPVATYAINAAAKVITITPSSNLATTTAYFIALADVTDVFGQKLADTVLKFTTI